MCEVQTLKQIMDGKCISDVFDGQQEEEEEVEDDNRTSKPSAAFLSALEVIIMTRKYLVSEG